MEHLEFMLDLANSDAANGASAIKNWQPIQNFMKLDGIRLLLQVCC